MPKILIACETSGIVRNAFLDRGFDAYSCDLLPSDTPSNRHFQADVREVMRWEDWDMMAVMHPPCTRLTNSGVRWLSKPPANRQPHYPEAYDHWDEDQRLAYMWRELDKGAALFSDCWNADIPLVAIENPVMHKHAKARIRNFEPHAQSVQPWQFGTDEDGPDNEKKRTCFWLRGLPPLVPTGTLDGATARDTVHKASPGKERWKLRSKFYPGIAAAMADQWGAFATQNAALRLSGSAS